MQLKTPHFYLSLPPDPHSTFSFLPPTPSPRTDYSLSLPLSTHFCLDCLFLLHTTVFSSIWSLLCILADFSLSLYSSHSDFSLPATPFCSLCSPFTFCLLLFLTPIFLCCCLPLLTLVTFCHWLLLLLTLPSPFLHLHLLLTPFSLCDFILSRLSFHLPISSHPPDYTLPLPFFSFWSFFISAYSFYLISPHCCLHLFLTLISLHLLLLTLVSLPLCLLVLLDNASFSGFSLPLPTLTLISLVSPCFYLLFLLVTASSSSPSLNFTSGYSFFLPLPPPPLVFHFCLVSLHLCLLLLTLVSLYLCLLLLPLVSLYLCLLLLLSLHLCLLLLTLVSLHRCLLLLLTAASSSSLWSLLANIESFSLWSVH